MPVHTQNDIDGKITFAFDTRHAGSIYDTKVIK